MEAAGLGEVTGRYCQAPGCRQEPSGLRADGLCFAHGKAADGLLSLGVIGSSGRPVTKYHGPEPRPKLVRLPTFPVRSQ